MTTYYLASDLHFGGEEDQRLLDLLGARLQEDAHRCGLIIPGDLTQNGKKKEYKAAGRWLQEVLDLGIPVVVTPGNHDFGRWEGFVYGQRTECRGRYREHIQDRVKKAAERHPTWKVKFGKDTMKYDSITILGDDVFVSLRSTHRAGVNVLKAKSQPPFRTRSNQVDWAERRLIKVRRDHPDARLHLVTHVPIWARPWREEAEASLKAEVKAAFMRQYGHKQGRRNRLEKELLKPFRFSTFIHGHNHLLSPLRQPTPKKGFELDRLAVPTLSRRDRKPHPPGFLRWTPGAEPVVVALTEDPVLDQTGKPKAGLKWQPWRGAQVSEGPLSAWTAYLYPE